MSEYEKPRLAEAERGLRQRASGADVTYFFVGQQVENLLSSRMIGEGAQVATSTFLTFAFLVFASAADTPRPANSTATARDEATIFSVEATPINHARYAVDVKTLATKVEA
jgi:hypothetical protein